MDATEETEGSDDRPLYGRRRRTLLRVVVLVAVAAMVLPILANLVAISAATAADSCGRVVAYLAPDASGSAARFEVLGAGGLGWECYALGGFGADRHVVSLGLVPGMVELPGGVDA